MPAPADLAQLSVAQSSSPGSVWVRRVAAWGGWLLLALLVLAASLWLLFRHWFWPGVDQWRPRIEQALSAALETPVTMGELSSGFEGYRPSLRARAVRVGSGTDAALTIEEVSAVLSLRALARGEAGLASLELLRPVIRVERLEPRRFAVAGALVDLDRTGSSEALAWLLASRSISVRNARVDWRDRLGSEPAVIAGVDLLSTSDGVRHHFSLRAPSMGLGLSGIEFAADFSTPTASDLADWKKWRGELYASAREVEFVPLVRVLRGWLSPAQPEPQVVQSGRGPVKAWLRFSEGRVIDTLLKTVTESIDLRIGGGRVALRSLSIEAFGRLDPAGPITLYPRKFAAVDAAGFAFTLDEQAEQRITLAADTLLPVAGRLSLRGFDASRLLEAARRLPLPDRWLVPLSQVAVSGRVTAASMAWDAAGEQPSVSIGFERLSLRRTEPRGAPASRWPAFTNLSGSVDIAGNSGQLRLESSGASIRLPGVLAEPQVPLASLAGTVGWQIGSPDESGAQGVIELFAAGLNFANTDLAGSLSGRWRSGGRSALGEVDLAATLTRANPARVAAYLPVSIDTGVRSWVGRAVAGAGRAEARVRLRGDLADFPFREASLGEFRVEAKLDQAALGFLPQWPAIDRIRGTLTFDRAAMDLKAESAATLGVGLREISARIPDLARPAIAIRGLAQGPLATMLGYVHASPIGRDVDPQMKGWQTEGAADLALELDIGLGQGGATAYSGRVVFSDNELRMAPGVPAFTGIAGEVRFDTRGIRSESLNARWLGGPLQAKLNAPTGGALRIDARGALPAAELGALFPDRRIDQITGHADWQASVDVGPQGIHGRLDSRLEAIGSAFPAPFAKKPGSAWPLHVDWTRPRDAQRAETVRIRLRDDVQAIFERSAVPHAARAVIAVGTPAQLPSEGMALDLRIPHLDMGEWERAFATRPPDASARAVATPVPMPGGRPADTVSQSTLAGPIAFDRVSLITDSLIAGGKDFTSVVMGATRLDRVWRASIAAREINGLVAWQPARAGLPAGAVQARLSVLNVPRNRQSDIERLLDTAPTRLPALDIETDRLILSGRELGQMSLRAANATDGDHPTWQLERLRIDHPGGRLDATGTWEASRLGAARWTALNFELGLREPARLLETFGVVGAVSGGGPGRLAGSVRWEGSPLAIDYRSLTGELEFQAGKGQFLKTEPGLGKLIGVLNLQSLPRRLSLDFRDIFAEGFAFDEIGGRAAIASGVAATSDFRMRGVQAQVGIRGSVNLADETQKLRVEVRPELNAGLASLAYAAVANPAIGLGTFLAQWAFRKPLQDMFSYEYDIAGSWADPNVVERARPRFDVPAAPAPR